jgi:photosynthetic reaction center cytochrome c subunit
MTHRRTFILAALAVTLTASGALAIHAQAPQQAPSPTPPPPQQTQSQPAGAPSPNQLAEQRFKNIQVLKGVPADQVIPAMQFISASLGVECQYCHVEHAFDKDDKKEKRTAREMITMMMAINKDNFRGEREVTCNTCHRGATHPMGVPLIPDEATLAATNSAPPTAVVSANTALPTADAILAKYLDAVGGKAALEKVQTREQTGTMHVGAQPGGHDAGDAGEQQFPITIYSEAPDKRISKTKMNGNESVTAYNGTVGWMTTPGGVRPMNTGEGQAASIDAQLHFASALPQLYTEFRVRPGDMIDGKATYVVSANGKDQLPLRLYFDQQTGLLLRLIRYAETPLGRLPTQIDYADYRKADDVLIPYRWTLARPNGRFTIQIDTVKHNGPIDEKLFVAPPPGPPPAGPGAGAQHGPPPPSH